MTELIAEHAEIISTIAALLMPVVLCGMTLVAIVLFRSLRLSSRQVQELHAAQQLNIAAQANITEVLNRFEDKLAQITERNLEIQTQSFINSSVDEASRLARRGAPAQTLVESCGLSDGEAELMVQLHHRQRPRKVQA